MNYIYPLYLFKHLIKGGVEMPIFKTAYETTACSGFQIKRTAEAVKVANAHGHLSHKDSPKCRQVEGGASVVDDIPAFAHPLLVGENEHGSYLVMDARPFGSWDRANGNFRVRNAIEYDIAVYRLKLNAVWLEQNPAVLRDLSTVPMDVYAAWISEAIARRFMLDPREQYLLAILAAFFYTCLFTEQTGKLDDREAMRAATAISRTTNSKAEDVLEVIEQLDVLSTASDFCTAAAIVTGSVRLKELNAGLLFSILGGTWFGTNAKEMVAVAVEHPPTWIAILVAAFNSRTFKNATITKIAEARNKRDAGPNFIRAVQKLITTDFGL